FTLQAGIPLLEAARRGFAAEGFASGVLNIKGGGTLGPFAYVMPALSKTGENAAFYSETFRPDGNVWLKQATMTLGERDGAPRVAFDVSHAEGALSRRRDPLAWLAFLALAAALVAFPAVQAGGAWKFGLGFSVALLVAFALLAGVARTLIWAARRFLPARWPYAWRQGVANLHRPNNRTLLLTFTLGLSTFLLLGLDLTKTALLRQFASPRDGGSNGPNLVFFDIGSDQRAAVADLARAQGLTVLEDVPVVQMRLTSLKGEPVEKLLRDRGPQGAGGDERSPQAAGAHAIPDWRLRHEYRSTYRDHLTAGEEITSGHWTGRAQLEKDAPVPVSIEAEAARELRLKPGDALVFDVQGVSVPAVIGSVRKVEWGRFQPNFFFVFPAGGGLEEAPAFHVLVTRAGNAAQSGAAQAALVKAFPNVAAIDLSLIVQTVQGIVDKATTAVRFLSIFTVGTGLLVLAAAILTGRFERIRESVLLRTLGASRRQVFTVLVVEYLALGLLAALTGAVLAAAGSWALEVFVFKIPWLLPPLPLAISVGLACALTVGIGLLASRGVCDHPPLEILRQEE
ncbi:MAG: FtsX-like permease family protein, partial [Verrucomicrobia bacterium]|nr:FtsX-like permease family protein [Verrucomicrobiota bacterium]